MSSILGATRSGGNGNHMSEANRKRQLAHGLAFRCKPSGIIESPQIAKQ